MVESSDLDQTPIRNTHESTLPIPNRDVEPKPPLNIQQPPSHTSDLPSKFTSPSECRQRAAKLYRAKLWLACSGIYRRGSQWDGAQAAIQDALLCDICPEEVFTEVIPCPISLILARKSPSG
jgi:hypothetical protein